MMRQIKNSTSITDVGGLISFEGKSLPYALFQWGGAISTRDMCNVKDETREFGIRVVAGSEDQLYTAVEEITTLWNKTGVGSLFEEIHQQGVMSLQHRTSAQPMVFQAGENQTVDVMFRVDIRYTYQNK
jgi:hypothetical protein